MMRPTKPALALMLAVATSVASAVPATAPKPGLKIALKSYLDSKSLKSSDIKASVTVLAADAGWTTGVFGTLLPSYFALRRGGGPVDRSVSTSMRIRYENNGALVAKVELCQAIGGCEEQQISRKSLTAKVTAAGQEWQIDGSKGACGTESTCTATIPSWAMAQRLQSDGGGMKPFPKVATIIHHGKTIAVFNALTAENWANWTIDGLDEDLGQLRHATLGERGFLSLDFDGGILTADFARDLLLIASDSGMKVANAGLGGVSDATIIALDQIKVENGGNFGRALAVGNNLVIWENGWASVPSDNSNMVKAKGAFHAFSGKALTATAPTKVGEWARVALRTGSSLSLVQYDPATSDFAAIGALGVVPSSGLPPAAELRIANDHLMHVGPTGGALFVDNKFEPLSVNGTVDLLTVTADGQVFAKTALPGGVCTVSHWKQRDDSTAFKETGLAAACGSTDHGDADGERATITSRTGSDVSVFVLQP